MRHFADRKMKGRSPGHKRKSIQKEERSVYKVALSLADAIKESIGNFDTKELANSIGQLKEIADRPNVIDFDKASKGKKK